MPKRRCAVSHCRVYVDIPQRYCEQHKDQQAKTYNNQVRTSPDNKKYYDFYNSGAWKRTRANKLSLQPLCEVCLRDSNTKSIADMVHHRHDIRTHIGWEQRLSLDNLESICYACHNAQEHSASFRHRRG